MSRFIRELQGLSVPAWQRVVEALTPARQDGSRAAVPLLEELADQAARHRLRVALETMPWIVDRIRHRVDAVVTTMADLMPEDSLARMRRAARLAALALAAQPLLRPEDLARLCRPFRMLAAVTVPTMGG